MVKAAFFSKRYLWGKEGLSVRNVEVLRLHVCPVLTCVVQGRCLHRAASFPSFAPLAPRRKFGQGPCAKKRPRGKRMSGHTWLKRETTHHVAQERLHKRARHMCLRLMRGTPYAYDTPPRGSDVVQSAALAEALPRLWWPLANKLAKGVHPIR